MSDEDGYIKVPIGKFNDLPNANGCRYDTEVFPKIVPPGTRAGVIQLSTNQALGFKSLPKSTISIPQLLREKYEK